MDSVGGSKERNPTRRGEEEGAPDMRGHGVSDTQGRKTRCARVCQAAGACWARPKRGNGVKGNGPRGWEAGGPRAIGGCWAELGRKPKERKILFSFFFSNISKHFQIILNPLLNLNQTTHYKIFKCNSMSAQTCSYPYI
jgi:hypothetical protein